MFLARRGLRRSYDTTSRRVCAKLKRGACQVYGTNAERRRLNLNRRREIFVERSRCCLICWGTKNSSRPSVRSPTLRRKRQTQIHFLTPNACGLKAGLHANFPQERLNESAVKFGPSRPIHSPVHSEAGVAARVQTVIDLRNGLVFPLGRRRADSARGVRH